MFNYQNNQRPINRVPTLDEYAVAKKEMDYGWAWIKDQQRIICAVYEFKRGRNKGKVRVTLCRGRDKAGAVVPGRKVIIPFDSLIELPPDIS